MTTDMNRTRYELTDEELNQVTGSTFTRNKFSEDTYNRYGIRTDYHVWSKDEFWLPDGTKTDHDGANEYLEKILDKETYNALADSHKLKRKHVH